MANKKTNLKRILATSACGAALAGALFLAEKKQDRRFIRTKTGAIPTTLARDSVDFMTILTDSLNVLELGNYSPFSDTVLTHYFYSTIPIDIIKEKTDNLNYQMIFTDYHELRHAFNRRLMIHFKWDIEMVEGKKTFDIHPDLFAADEISARIAGQLAEIGKMPNLTPGKLSPCISYQIDPIYDYEINDVADILVSNALCDLQKEDIYKKYSEIWHGFGVYYLNSLQQKPRLSKKELINEVMTFEINGKKRNILKLASKETQKKVQEFFDVVKQEEQLLVSSILDEYNRQHKL